MHKTTQLSLMQNADFIGKCLVHLTFSNFSVWYQWHSQLKFEGGRFFILGEQQYFLWDTTSQSTK